jgi:SAM-dependent methyltransferase
LLGNAPKNLSRSDVRVLELGCGTGNNLWFAAREGFQVCGLDASATAVAFARERLEAEGLTADVRVGDFTQKLPYPDAFFDFIIDRAALSLARLRRFDRLWLLKSGFCGQKAPINQRRHLPKRLRCRPTPLRAG